MPTSPKSESAHAVAIALGSNMGDRYACIESALRELERRQDVITVSRTSFLYESDPMYVEDQDKFLNCAIMVGVSTLIVWSSNERVFVGGNDAGANGTP